MGYSLVCWRLSFGADLLAICPKRKNVMQPDTQSLTAAGLNLIGQALTIYDVNLRLVVCNAPFKAMFDLPDALVTPGALFEDTIRHLMERGEYGEVEDIEQQMQERVRIAKAFEPHYMERKRANGRTISVEGSPLPQGGWVTVYTDITQAKRQETLLRTRASELSEQLLDHSEALAATNRELAATNAALEEAKRQLTDSEARVRLTTEMMPAHIAHADANQRYTYSNRRLNSIMPGRPSDVVGLDFETALGASAYARVKPHLLKAYRGQSSVLEFTHDESARRIRTAFTPDEAGGVNVLSMDVTEETQARVALQQTRKRELAAQLTSGLAHDFSNLLTIILGLQSQIEGLPDLPDSARSMVEGTRAAARRGGELLEGIASVTASRSIRPAAVDLVRLLKGLLTLTAPTLPKGIDLDFSCDLPERPVLVDGGLLQDSLLNLILNARDACGTTGKICLTARAAGETWLEFTVTDTGPGFSTDALQRALDPFFTTKGAEGTGLGLPMVYDIAKLAGGDLRLSNRAAQGAQVQLRLPLRFAPESTGGLVLLVEDDEVLRNSYRDMLMTLGHSVIEAVSADEALALLATLPDVTLVLSDVRIEGAATGVDLARQIAGKVPVVLMTSLPQSDPLHQSASQSAPLLRKPFAADDLMAVLRPAAAQ